MQTTIVSTGPVPEWFIRDQFPGADFRLAHDPSRRCVLSLLDEGVSILIARSNTPVTREFFEAAPHLRAVARTGVGFDSIDVAEATSRGIPVLYTPGALTRAVAEHAVAMILTLYKDLLYWNEEVLAGKWEAREHRRSPDLSTATLGIVGFGRIGSSVFRFLQPLCRETLAFDPFLDPLPAGPRFVSRLEDLLEASDIVTLHAPLNESSRAMINGSTVSHFKPGAVLINTARGGLMESYDILNDALEEGRLRGVACDTLIDEPPLLQHPFFKHHRVLLSPHVAARTPESQKRIFQTLAVDLQAILRGERPVPENLVNPEVWASSA